VRLLAALLLVASGAAAAPSVLDLRVARPDGTAAALREVVGARPAVVVFWATYCAPCRAEVPAINRAAERWRERGLRVLGVALDGDPARVRDAQRDWDMRYDVLSIAEGQQEATDALFPRGLPAAAFVAHGTATLHERILDDDTLGRMVPPLLEPAAASDSR
jgi:thiol-disulfide isomerase/thioredoxin